MIYQICRHTTVAWIFTFFLTLPDARMWHVKLVSAIIPQYTTVDFVLQTLHTYQDLNVVLLERFLDGFQQRFLGGVVGLQTVGPPLHAVKEAQIVLAEDGRLIKWRSTMF